MAFIIGKQKVAFGQDFDRMPIWDNTVMGSLVSESKVMGFTMALDTTDFMALFDSMELSIHESEDDDGKDMELGVVDSFSFRITKSLAKSIKAQASILHDQNQGVDDDSETRVSLGLVFDDGRYTAWIEGVVLDNNGEFEDADLALNSGFSVMMGPGEVVVNGSWIEESIASIGLGFQLHVTEDLNIGPEVRYHTCAQNQTVSGMCSAGGDEVIGGVRVMQKFGGGSKKKNKVFLFGNKNK